MAAYYPLEITTYIIIIALLSLICGQDPDAVEPSPPTAPPEVEADTTERNYIRDKAGQKCLLAEFGGRLNVPYEDSDGKEQIANLSFDGNDTWIDDASSSCGDNKATVAVQWNDKKYNLALTFSKLQNDNSWIMSAVRFNYSTQDNPDFKGIKTEGTSSAAASNLNYMSSPIGMYHTCPQEEGISLKGDQNVDIQLNTVKIQPFPEDETWGEGHQCPLTSRGGSDVRASERSAAAVAVGIVLALVAVGVVVGYAARRYYREKIAYNTM